MNKGLKGTPRFLGKTRKPGGVGAGLVIRGGTFRLITLGATTILGMMTLIVVNPVYVKVDSTEALTGTATDSVITFTSTSSTASVAVNVTSPDGTFATSTDGTNNTTDQRIKFSIATNNYTGYTLNIAAGNNAVTTLSDNNNHTIASISSATTATDFADTGDTGKALNNKWGFIPSYYNSVVNTTTYYPALSSNTDAPLRVTSSRNSANGEDNADEYTIGLGLRADFTNPKGTYESGTFILQYVANAVSYSITYDTNTTGTVTNMPSPNPQQSDSVTSTTVLLSSNTPVHENDAYIFKGWCSTATTKVDGEDTCSGTTYQPGGIYGIDKTSTNVTTLYAMWGHPDCNDSATTINTGDDATDAVCMQDMNDSVISSMTTHTQYQLYDNRDWKKYFFAKMADGRVWMTQNLDLDLESTPTNVARLTSLNTDLNTAYATGSNETLLPGYSVSENVITWTPSEGASTSATAGNWKTTTTAGATTNYNALPQSFDYGEYYYYTTTTGTNQTYNTKSACESAHNDGTCAHFHVGNYYDWTAAVAMNSTNSTSYSGVDNNYYSANYFTAANSICPAGWRLPQGRTSTNSGNVGYYGEVNYTWAAEGIITNYVASVGSNGTYKTSGYINISNAPLYSARSGYKTNTSNPGGMGTGYYWTSTVSNNNYAYSYYFSSSYPYPMYASYYRYHGMSVRCVAKQSSTGSTTITFDKNADDATGEMSTQSISANTWGTLSSNGYSRSGYVFNSWNTAADGSGTSYADAAQYYAGFGNNSATLYARWDKVSTITFALADATSVVFNGTTYTNGQTAQGIEGRTYNIYGNYATKHGFSSWSATSGTFANSAYPTTTYTVANDATITLTGQEATIEMKTLTNPTGGVASTCKNDAVTPTLVYDERDNEAYWVAVLCDGKYWMLDNLRLNVADNNIVMNSTNTNATNEVISCLRTGKYDGVACTSPYSGTAVSTSWSNQYNQPKINITNKDIIPTSNGTQMVYGKGSGKVGVYYNYCAASAGSYCYVSNTPSSDPNTSSAIDAPYDICPAGWRMPTGGAYNATTGGGDYQNLYNKYSGASAGQAAAFRNALSTPLSGYFNSGSADSQGSNGYFWSSTYGSGNSMYRLRVYSSDVNPQGSNGRYRGFSVRCVRQ